MLCILAFILLVILFPILGFFPSYRQLFRKSWDCFWNRVTLKPCDVDFGQELKDTLLSKFALRYPKITNFFDKTFTFWAFLFVFINVWSLWTASLAGLNLWVYDTCDPYSEEGCSLAGDSCEVGANNLTFTGALEEDRLGDWIIQPFSQFGQTVSRIPDRLQEWKPEDYLPPNPTYFIFSEDNPVALEIIDPGCPSCKQLWKNIKETDFTDTYNLTYILYPIPSQSSDHGRRFNNSYLMARYLEASKNLETNLGQETPLDWQILDQIFNGQNSEGVNYQTVFTSFYANDSDSSKKEMENLLSNLGLSPEQVAQVSSIADSEEVAKSLDRQKEIVENEVRTVKIPTIMFDGRRYDRVVSTKDLNR